MSVLGKFGVLLSVFKSSFWATVSLYEWRFQNYRWPLSLKFLNTLLILKAGNVAPNLFMHIACGRPNLLEHSGMFWNRCPEEKVCEASLCLGPVGELGVCVCELVSKTHVCFSWMAVHEPAWEWSASLSCGVCERLRLEIRANQNLITWTLSALML